MRKPKVGDPTFLNPAAKVIMFRDGMTFNIELFDIAHMSIGTLEGIVEELWSSMNMDHHKTFRSN